MEDLKQRVVEKVDENWERELGFLRGLVRRPSTLGNEALVQHFVAEELKKLGLEPDVWQIDQAEIARMPGYSPVEWSYEGRPNIAAVWRSRSGGGRSLLFNGHVDVVPSTPDHHWTHDPWGER